MRNLGPTDVAVRTSPASTRKLTLLANTAQLLEQFILLEGVSIRGLADPIEMIAQAQE